jgi:RNA polymerase sigma-70 factor, ECF subfamily
VARFRDRTGGGQPDAVAAPTDPVTRDALLAGAGDDDAFARVVAATQADVWRLCCVLGSLDTADDLVQETYLRAWRGLPGFRGDASARTWILAVARRVAADHVRAARRLRRIATLPPPPAVSPDQTGGVDVNLLIAGLDDDRRLAIFLTQMLGLSYQEAATVCACPIGTIRSRVARARDELIDGLRSAEAQ